MFTRLLALAVLLIPTAWIAAADTSAGKIRVLLVGGQNNHDWRKKSDFLLALLATQKHLLVEESNSPPAKAAKDAWDAWKPDFAKYDAVLLNYNGEMWPDDVKASMEKYLNDGGGVMPLHAANNSFTGWNGFEQAVGLLWRGKEFGASVFFDEVGKLQREEKNQGRGMGHGSQYDWKMTVRDTTNPITTGMPVTWIHRYDELYHGQRGPAEKLNILLSAFSDPKKGGTGKDEPIVWWVPVGKGKMLTNVMGHVGDTACLSCVGYQTVLLRSIEWLAKGSCTTTIPADFPKEKASQNYPGGVAKVLPSAKDLSIEESMKRFKLPPGYRIELVAQEPAIINPVCFAWDGNGNLYVCEMRTYMMDADAKDEDKPLSRVSKLSDTNGDGVLDKVTVFLDNLVLPRMVLPLDDRVVIAETYTGKFVSYKDTNGDGVADENELVFDAGKQGGNLEHQDSALTWGSDNFIYTAQNGSRRFRIGADGKWTTDQIYGRGSQWGMAIDDLGRMVSATGGGENGAFGFQQHPSYGALSLPGELDADFQMVYPRMQTVDVQGGLGRVHPIKGTVNHITACAGQSIFRGDQMGDMKGDYILPEPVGRLVRRAKVNVVDGKRVLVNAYPGDEFITSTDPAFRPVWSATGPDGCLYIGDLHNGIVQEGNWTKPGSYLREMIDRDGHARYVGHGRIYRVVHETSKPGPRPALLAKKPAELVEVLSHPNGWWRDTAQQLIVLRADKSVVPALQSLVRGGKEPMGRVHALWALDGLGATDRALLLTAFKDADPRVRVTAIRISEALFKQGDAELVAEYTALGKDKDIDVVVQVINTLRYSKDPAVKKLILDVAAKHPGNEIIAASAQQSSRFDPDRPSPFNPKLDPGAMALAKKGNEHYTQLCFACHGADGKGIVSADGMRMGPTLAGSPRVLGNKEAVTRIVLHGLMGELDGKTYAGLMLPMKGNDDQWLAEVLTYVRTAFGNSASSITKDEVAKIRAATKDRQAPYTIAELGDLVPVSPEQMSKWAFAASSNSDKAKNAVDGDAGSRWDTGAGQKAGQWFQVDMGKPWSLSQIAVECNGSANDYPRGWEIRLSDDGQKWSEPIAKGEANKPVLEVAFPKGTTARYVRLIQTASGKTGLYWSIHELSVCGAEKK
ncbi:MAG: ThuA domain-containing protein [Planctomycetes bacterium]|nr:ThuA domain-containing protein [Planctomycetota bacterium]